MANLQTQHITRIQQALNKKGANPQINEDGVLTPATLDAYAQWAITFNPGHVTQFPACVEAIPYQLIDPAELADIEEDGDAADLRVATVGIAGLVQDAEGVAEDKVFDQTTVDTSADAAAADLVVLGLLDVGVSPVESTTATQGEGAEYLGRQATGADVVVTTEPAVETKVDDASVPPVAEGEAEPQTGAAVTTEPVGETKVADTVPPAPQEGEGEFVPPADPEVTTPATDANAAAA